MDGRDRLRWTMLVLVGVVVVVGGSQDSNDTQVYIGVGIIALAILGAWWHSELLRRKREAEDTQDS